MEKSWNLPEQKKPEARCLTSGNGGSFSMKNNNAISQYAAIIHCQADKYILTRSNYEQSQINRNLTQ